MSDMLRFECHNCKKAIRAQHTNGWSKGEMSWLRSDSAGAWPACDCTQHDSSVT